VWQPLFAEIDERWRSRFGDALGTALTAVVRQLPASLPDCLPILGYGLHTKWNDDHPPAPQEPLPLSALLSRTVFAFALDVARAGPVSIALGANVLRVLDDKGVRVRDLSTLTGVAKPAVDISVGFLERNGYAVIEPGRGRQIRLTDRGRAARTNMTRVLADVEATWQDKYPTTNLRAALTPLSGEALRDGMEPYPNGWRASINPPTTLPWYPTVLHRGGYPDGS
jgi:DNA-binding MarR family transcriptional regulator